MDDINKQIEENTPLVFYIIRKYYPSFIQDDDIVQSGMIGLWKALKYFDEAKNIKFGTFATKVIVNQINMELRKRRKQVLHISLDTAISNSEDNDLTLYDVISDNLSGVQDYSTLNLEDCLSSGKFTDKERTILIYKYRGYTQKKIGDKMGISQPQICRIEKNIKKKFKQLYGEEIRI